MVQPINHHKILAFARNCLQITNYLDKFFISVLPLQPLRETQNRTHQSEIEEMYARFKRSFCAGDVLYEF